MPNLLIEIGTEEIPAGYIAPALEQFAQLLRDGLAEHRLACDGIETAATPRRLVVFAADVPDRQPDVTQEAQGPPATVAFDADGSPTKAGIGFARKHGVEPSALVRRPTDRGDYAFAIKKLPGEPAAHVLAQMLPGIIAAIRFPKSMRWVAGGILFARPIRSLLALLGETVIDFEINGVRSGRITHGHPFLAPGGIEIRSADIAAYKRALADRYVIVDIHERRELIRTRINALLARYGSQLDNEPLLDEVTQLVEWPNVVEGRFAPQHVHVVPDDVTVAAMTEHQRYFPVRDASGNLLPKFITVINRPDDHADVIREGNERVLAARLSDAEFFWHEDIATPLASKVELLKGVVFQQKLGTYYDKTLRLMRLAEYLGARMGLDAQLCTQAARLCKADLVTQMVKEFPRLQGIMGREYACHEQADPDLASALAEH